MKIEVRTKGLQGIEKRIFWSMQAFLCQCRYQILLWYGSGETKGWSWRLMKIEGFESGDNSFQVVLDSVLPISSSEGF
jgi:hypothetical protein